MKETLLTIFVIFILTTTILAQPDESGFALLPRVEIQLNRLTTLMNAGNAQEIRLLLGEDLLDSGLAEYLVELPPDYGEITVEMITTPANRKELFEVVLTTEIGTRFLALTGWQEEKGQLKLATFSLTPSQQPVPPQLRQSLENFVSELQDAVQTGQEEQLLALLGSDVNQEQAWEFFSSLNTRETWKLVYVALEPVGITIAVPHSFQLQLLINLGLVAAETGWLIETLEAVPLP